MNIIYLHGLGSAVQESNIKYSILERLGKVYPLAPDYTWGLPKVIDYISEFYNQVGQVALLVGTSMGGYAASMMSAKFNTPFIALNPSINPSQTLQKYLDFYPDLTRQVIDSYQEFIPSDLGKVFVNLGDDVIDSYATSEFVLAKGMQLKQLEGGEHSFQNIEDIFEDIKEFIAGLNK